MNQRVDMGFIVKRSFGNMKHGRKTYWETLMVHMVKKSLQPVIVCASLKVSRFGREETPAAAASCSPASLEPPHLKVNKLI